ncbi:MAG TPA: hypothetical protein VFJ90_12665, partial [Candidatus Didemnitutus sp.]|nr:hypothetical protein [Candidatus Didemnitutus sp.]
RAVTARDYEQLILQRFPSVFSARVVRPQNAAQAGRLTIIVLPRLASAPASVPPGFTPGELREIEQAIRALAPISAAAQISVRNPRYELLAIKASVRFTADRSFAHQRTRLVEALNAYISPWIYRQASVVDPFVSFHASDFGTFVRRQPYVLEAGPVEVLKDGVALDLLAPSADDALLQAAPVHFITPLVP